MKHLMATIALVAFAATPAAAQLWGMPNWNSPKGGTGITLNADLGIPNEDLGKGTAFGAHGSVGLGNLTVGAALASWKADGADESYTSFGANGAFRVIGGSLLPVAVNLQLGLSRTGEANLDPTLTSPAFTRFTAGGGVSTTLPTPGVSIEPYLSLTNRWYKESGVSGTESNFGWTLGANLGFGMFGVHLAYDSESFGGGTTGGIFGLGANVSLRAPVGL